MVAQSCMFCIFMIKCGQMFLISSLEGGFAEARFAEIAELSGHTGLAGLL